jgi:hypothetical protein
MTLKKTSTVLFVVLMGCLSLLLLSSIYTRAEAFERTVNLGCGQDIDSAINGDPTGISTRFILAADCTYVASATLQPRDGEQILCAIDPAFIIRDNAWDPEPRCQIDGSPTLTQVMKPQGLFGMSGVTLRGGTYNGQSGTGVGLAEGLMTNDSWLWGSVIRDNQGTGISNAHGNHRGIELTNNTTNPNALGHIGAGIKGVDEFNIDHSYIHETQGNGVWCDVYCNDISAAFNAFHVNFNLIVNNGRAGVRFEESNDSGQDSQPTAGEALIENNEIHGNGWNSVRGGVSVHDAAHALVRNNTFGAKTVTGGSYPGNVSSIAVRITDSGRSDRPDTADVNVVNNTLNGETIKTCGGVVICQGNL